MNIHSCRFKCSECGKCFESNNALTIHGRIHSGEKPFGCSVCGKRFRRAGHLRTHNRIHSGEKPYICNICHKAFSHHSQLTAHMRVHTGDKPYNCSLCNKRFNQSSTLERHKRCIHSNRRPYPCPFCGKLFKTSDYLMSHIRVHAATKEFSCRHCSECFRWRHQLKSHLVIYWSHTVKALGSRVTFVRRSSASKISLRNTYSDMKVWSHTFAMNVRSVSVPDTDWKLISWCTLTSKGFAVVCVVKILSINIMSKFTLGDVLLFSDMKL